MKKWCVGLAAIVLLGGCKGKTGANGDAAGPEKQKIYTLADVNKEMKELGVQLSSTQEDLRNFAKAHPNYEVCQDTDYLFVARIRNSKIDKQASDQYILATYDKDGKILNLEVGPPEFSAGNLQRYCH